MRTPSRKKRLDKARRALQISPDCADAYTILAQAEEDCRQRLTLFKEAVSAGERALKIHGIEINSAEKGEMWSIPATTRE